MRPAISDSLISGQPLYLLNSKSNCGAPLLSAWFAAALATQATGSVRLHVTGKPPTTNGLAVAAEAGGAMAGSAAASAPRSSRRRSMQCGGNIDSPRYQRVFKFQARLQDNANHVLVISV
jgi:hypothetical protein